MFQSGQTPAPSINAISHAFHKLKSNHQEAPHIKLQDDSNSANAIIGLAFPLISGVSLRPCSINCW
ncbi:hypothetical protein II582_04370 [bacterium]|nr:hypothetical protein [bacterium]